MGNKRYARSGADFDDSQSLAGSSMGEIARNDYSGSPEDK